MVVVALEDAEVAEVLLAVDAVVTEVPLLQFNLNLPKPNEITNHSVRIVTTSQYRQGFSCNCTILSFIRGNEEYKSSFVILYIEEENVSCDCQE